MTTVIDVMKTKTIDEKVSTFSAKEDIDYSYLEEWRNVRTLLSDKYLKIMLEESSLSKNQLAYALQSLEHEQNRGEQADWLKLFYEIMNEFDYKSINYELGVLVPSQPFAHFLRKKLMITFKSIKNIEVSEQVLDKFVEAHLRELFEVSGKIVALKLEEFKKSKKNPKRESDDKFHQFLCTSFHSKNSFYKFYEEFSVLARISTMRTIFLLESFTMMLENIDNDYLEIQNFLKLSTLKLTNIVLSTGDSHERGKSVSIVNFQEKKLVYKPKDLNISKAFEKFIDWYTSNSNLLDIKIPKGIYKDKYTYNEYIEPVKCKSICEIENYYERYGYLIAICYIFSLNDLHVENLIANGGYPVIIDLETMFHVSSQMENDSLYFELLRKLELESVSSSFLLPTKLQIGEDNSVDLSALSGKKVELNQKILGPVDINTDNFHYKKIPSYFDGGNNIPKINDLESVNYEVYVLKIIEGFDKFIDFVQKNKVKFCEIIEIFSDKKTRVILKGTEKYMSMIRYSNHPSYNKEMKYRERLMMNLWAYPYKDKRVVKSEVTDLLFNDIPIFYSYSNSRDLYDSRGQVYTDYFEITGLQQSINRILSLNKKSIFNQRSILLSSLNLWDQFLNKPVRKKDLIFKSQRFDLLAKAKNICELLKEDMIFKQDQCSLVNVDCSESKHWKIVPSDESLYGGLSGIALLFLESYVVSNEKKYFDFYKILIKTAVKQSRSLSFSGAFSGWLSPIYPMILEYKYLGTIHDRKFFDYTMKKLSELTAEQIENFKDIDYISGLAGIIRLLSTTKSLITNDPFVDTALKNFSSVFIEKIESDNFSMSKLGIAHGISGIMLGLVSLPSGICKTNFIKKQLASEFKLFNLQENSYKWCWGLSGMIQARLAIFKIAPRSIDENELDNLIKCYWEISNKLVDEDSLCHGNGSVIITMKMIFEYTEDERWNNLAYQWLSNIAMYAELHEYKVPYIGDVSAKGLFDGISGVGWLYLYMYQPNNNILLLEV